MAEIFSSAYFGIVLSVAAYQMGITINKRFDNVFTNPLFLSCVIVVTVLKIFHIPTEAFAVGGEVLKILIMPATVCLALSVYNNFDIVKNNIIPIVTGTMVGSFTSVFVVILLSNLLNLDQPVMMSIVPRSVTMPIALDISSENNGIIGLTTTCVMISGIFGAMIAPTMVKLLKLDSVTAGLSIGTSSHVAGTAKAVELGDIEGALSGIAIGFAGLFTVVWVIFI